jgi:hypothetical protein
VAVSRRRQAGEAGPRNGPTAFSTADVNAPCQGSGRHLASTTTTLFDPRPLARCASRATLPAGRSQSAREVPGVTS